jgi:hypothetical protein
MALVVLLLLEIRWIGKQIFKYLLGYKSTFYGQLIITIINDVSVRDHDHWHWIKVNIDLGNCNPNRFETIGRKVQK